MLKGRKYLILVCSIILLSIMIIYFCIHKMSKTNGEHYDLVIYGGGLQAVATALNASDVTKRNSSILIVVPERYLGSILTAGGQNLFDVREYKVSKLPKGLPSYYPYPQGGNMYTFMKEPSIVFSPTYMASYLLELTKLHPNIDILFEYDIAEVQTNSSKDKISSIKVFPLIKDQHSRYIFDEERPIVVHSEHFVDASETGRFISLSGLFNGVVGRGDIDKDEKQMAAGLMIKVKNINMEAVQKKKKEMAPFLIYYSHKNSLGILGGYEINEDNEFKKYSDQNQYFRIKPYNGGEDGYTGKWKQSEETEMWMNMLLIYDVDARKSWRDKVYNNGNYPENHLLDPEIAREMAIKEISSEGFIQLLRRLPGLSNVTLVYEDHEPVVGDILYIRESIHSTNPDGSFALNKEAVSKTGNDRRYYDRRVGLGYYNFDSNSYEKGESLSEGRPKEPWYVPYDVLLSPNVSNLLIPGYAANMDSYTFRAMRVYPNLVVLGDAAGVAMGLSLLGEFNLKHPTKEQMQLLQTELSKRNVILDK
ncbi:FAD-dependent oxidoreductase [Bacillus suaedaesalsae]|uniref:FAD-dependent oxidoreductase n=1 Tax=Bacillus suaedaesalsae TaxID=2810349 RepID=A0ABS2DNI0_9BACI|nr:FAD-dependent oxidoreductase [Bacillus suaedaesalsae]MBM6619078.1 FAD-dependent oxidoreductase [Bacillus suaedaesalsae]